MVENDTVTGYHPHTDKVFGKFLGVNIEQNWWIFNGRLGPYGQPKVFLEPLPTKNLQYFRVKM